MFYSQYVLSKKGPLGTIWIAAHLERKLRKHHIVDTNISTSVDMIIFQKVPIALRLAGHLLLGVVRIYSRKVDYLYHDCSEALHKLKLAFYTRSVDLPPDEVKASFRAITLPETFDFDDFDMIPLLPPYEVGIDNHITGRDLITLGDPKNDRVFGSVVAIDERYSIKRDPYSVLGFSNEDSATEEPVLQDGTQAASPKKMDAAPTVEEDVLPPLPMDDEMDLATTPPHETDVDVGEQCNGSPLLLSSQVMLEKRFKLLEAEAPAEAVPGQAQELEVLSVEKLGTVTEYSGHRPLFNDGQEEMVPRLDREESSPIIVRTEQFEGGISVGPVGSSQPISRGHEDIVGQVDLLGAILGGRTPDLRVMDTPDVPPASLQRLKQARGKRKPIVDEGAVILPNQYMKKQLTEVDDLLRVRKRAPCTVREILKVQRRSYEEQCFAGTCFPGLPAELRGLYTRVLTSELKLPALESPEGPMSPYEASLVPINEIEIDQVNDNVPTESLEKSDQLAARIEQNVARPVTEEEEVLSVKDILEKDKHIDLTSLRQEGEIARRLEIGGKLVEEQMTWDVMIKGVTVAVQDLGPEPDRITFETSKKLIALPEENGLKDLGFLGDSEETVSLDSDDNTMLGADHAVDSNGTIVSDSSGWSHRTRAVAQHLKILFEKLETAKIQDQVSASKVRLSLESLLRGRSRKEAGRMFFEVLVLRTKNYIDVHQESGFGDIAIFPTSLLMQDATMI